jgi:hypothetical protein
MVVKQVHVGDLSVLEPEHDAPVVADPDASISVEVAPEGMQPERRAVHVARVRGFVEGGKNDRDPPDLIGAQLAAVAVSVELTQAPVPKPDDHASV